MNIDKPLLFRTFRALTGTLQITQGLRPRLPCSTASQWSLYPSDRIAAPTVASGAKQDRP